MRLVALLPPPHPPSSSELLLHDNTPLIIYSRTHSETIKTDTATVAPKGRKRGSEMAKPAEPTLEEGVKVERMRRRRRRRLA